MHMKEYKETLLCLAEGSACGILSLTFIFLLAGFLGKINPSCLFYDIKLTDCFTVILASITVLATINEYNAHRKREKAEVLGQYNERYSRDEHINKVVDYIIRYMDNNYVNPLPSVHDAEMFMRFFEEMEIQIEEGRLDEEKVHDLFAYYAMVLDASIIIREKLGINDYEKDECLWVHFKNFTNHMMTFYHLSKYIWEPTNPNEKPLVFKITDKNKKGKNEEQRIIDVFSYKQGLLRFDDKEYQYIFKGSNEPDELHCIVDNTIYKGKGIL